MQVRILYYNADDTRELDRFRHVIVNDLFALVTATETERIPTEKSPGIFVIEFITTSEVQHVRTILGLLGNSFELFDDSGTSIKKLIETARYARQIPPRKRNPRRTK